MSGLNTTVSLEFDSVFGYKNILLVAGESTPEWISLIHEFQDYFDEIVTVTELSQAWAILKQKRVTHLLIAEKFCCDLESAEVIRDWKRMFPHIECAVLAPQRRKVRELFDFEVDAPICCPYCSTLILHALFRDLV